MMSLSNSLNSLTVSILCVHELGRERRTTTLRYFIPHHVLRAHYGRSSKSLTYMYTIHIHSSRTSRTLRTPKPLSLRVSQTLSNAVRYSLIPFAADLKADPITFPEKSKPLDCVFGIVVVPRYTIVFQEHKQLPSVLLKSPLVVLRQRRGKSQQTYLSRNCCAGIRCLLKCTF